MHAFLVFLILLIFMFFISKTLTRSISEIIMRVTKNRGISVRIFHFLFLPGVFVHELSHMLIAELLFVKTHGLNLSPTIDGDSITMGSVEIEKPDPVRKAIIGFAPVFVGFLIISISTFYLLSSHSIFNLYISYALILIIVFEIGNTMFSSRKDLEGTLEFLLVLTIIFIVVYLFGYDFSEIKNILNTPQAQEVITKSIKIISIPIILDLIIIFISKLFFRALR